MTSETIAVITNVALTLTFFIALIFGIAEVRTAARDRHERLTLETLRNFQSHEFAELILFVTTRDFPRTTEEMQALPDPDRVNLIQFAQEMESLGILVAEKLINLDLADKTIGSLVTTGWEKYKMVFLDIRVKQPDPFLGEYFQWLAERIDERFRLNPRKPFFETNTPALGSAN